MLSLIGITPGMTPEEMQQVLSDNSQALVTNFERLRDRLPGDKDLSGLEPSRHFDFNKLFNQGISFAR